MEFDRPRVLFDQRNLLPFSSTGPWFVGEVMEGHIGVVFAWGTFVYSSYLPGSLTYAYGFLQVVLLVAFFIFTNCCIFYAVCIYSLPLKRPF